MTPKEYAYWIGFRRVDDACVPEGWRMERLRDVAKFRAGGRLGLTLSDYVPQGVDAYSAEGLNGKTAIKEFTGPAVIVSSIGARCGKCFFAAGDFTTLANVQVIFPSAEKLNAKFLWNVVNRESFWDRYATAQPFIRPSEIKKSWVPVPPPDEQTAIAHVLDAVDAAIDRAREALDRAHALQASTIHDLVADCSRNYRNEVLRNLIAEGPTNGLYRPESDYGAKGTPIVRIDSFSDGAISNLAGLRRVVVPSALRERFALTQGDVLINRVNALTHIGKAAIVPELEEPTIFESNMMRLRCSVALVPEYLGLILRSDIAKRHWLARAKPAVNQVSINQRDTNALAFPLPKPPRQCEIAQLVQASDTLAHRSLERFFALQTLKESLRHDLLTGAVRVNPALFPSEAAA
jgi:type I restriction enzyme, S subunit